MAKRKRYFAEGETVPWEEFRAFLTATRNAELTDDEALRRRECAKAIRALLNYYEFIALGIRRRDLDEAMLRGSIRGIMVKLVIDLRDVIAGAREAQGDDRTLEHLCWLYARWKMPQDPGIERVSFEPDTTP